MEMDNLGFLCLLNFHLHCKETLGHSLPEKRLIVLLHEIDSRTHSNMETISWMRTITVKALQVKFLVSCDFYNREKCLLL